MRLSPFLRLGPCPLESPFAPGTINSVAGKSNFLSFISPRTTFDHRVRWDDRGPGLTFKMVSCKDRKLMASSDWVEYIPLQVRISRGTDTDAL